VVKKSGPAAAVAHLLLALAGSAVASLGLELALRVSGYTPYYLEGHAFVSSSNPAMMYEPRPRFRGLYAGVPIEINSAGFRGREVRHPDGEKAFRIVVVGDSIAFGQGVSEADTLEQQLAARLERRLASPVEVLNLGVPGYDTCQEYWRFKERGLPLAPLAVLLVYVENDTDPSLFRIEGDAVLSPDVRTGGFHDFLAAARKHSDLYNLVWTRWQLLKHPRSSIERYRDDLAAKFGEGSPGWERSRACLGELVSLAQGRSIRVIVLPFPVLFGIDTNPYPFRAYVETTCGAARAAGAECLDVVPALQGHGPRLTVSDVEHHPSPYTYGRIAERIAELFP